MELTVEYTVMFNGRGTLTYTGPRAKQEAEAMRRALLEQAPSAKVEIKERHVKKKANDEGGAYI